MVHGYAGGDCYGHIRLFVSDVRVTAKKPERAMTLVEICRVILQNDEGWRSVPYYCSEGFPTIGYGFKIGNKGEPLPEITMTLEEGRKNLYLLIDDAINTLSGHINTRHIFNQLAPVRQAVLVSMFHQLGFTGLLKFRKMWIGIEAQNYGEAANQILDSKAARQAPARFQRNAQMMLTAVLPAHYQPQVNK